MTDLSTGPVTDPLGPGSSQSAAVSLRGVTKSFGSADVLKGIDLDLKRGTVSGLLGPNGAGKSTLIKILVGVHPVDAGDFVCRSASGAPDGVIGVIHQDLGLIESLTIRENLLLGVPESGGRVGLIDHRREREWARTQLEHVRMDIDVDTPLHELSLGERSLVAVAKMLSRDADVLILDEVTAALTRRESEWLLARMRDLADEGAAVVVVSHRLHEIATFCDEVHLLHDGRVGYSGRTPSLVDLHSMLTSGDVGFERAPVAAAECRTAVVAAEDVEGDGIGPLNFEISSGEVLALVGPLSSNLYAIGHTVAGFRTVTAGRLAVGVKDGQGRRGAVAFLPEDRKTAGILPTLDLVANTAISSLSQIGRVGWINRRRERERVADLTREMAVRPDRTDVAIESLSGGNQQKVLLARAAMRSPDLYVLCEPTRGVDISTRRAIYRFIDRIRLDGCAVLVVTIDVDDALAVSDRIGIVDSGRVVTIRHTHEVEADTLLEEVS